MTNIIHVHTGEVKAGHGDDVLQSTPIGSCVVIMAWSARGGLGAMAHVMLPGRAPKTAPVPTRYCINAIETLAERIAACEPLTETGVCLIGASNVLKKPDDTICHSNSHAITEYLKQAGVPVHASLLGGTQRRMARLHVREGCIIYTQGDSHEKMLWQSLQAQRLHEA